MSLGPLLQLHAILTDHAHQPRQVLIWDILDNLITDYNALFKGRTRFDIVIISTYVLSR